MHGRGNTVGNHRRCIIRPAMHSSPNKPAFSAPMAHFAEARKIFVKSCEADRDAILLAWQAGHKEVLLKRLHALKGALLVFGENDAATQCERLEQVLQANGVMACDAALRHLDRALRRLIDCYK
jgi:HPt (histidine-containing phosphotransfer) domain-containing protein